MEKVIEKVLSGYVGFGNLPSQVYKKSVAHGFEFTLMVVGASGLGKSTLINSLFFTDIYSDKPLDNAVNYIPKTTSIETTKVHLFENEINLTLTLVDTPGFADLIDNFNCSEPILCYINEMYEEYFENESKVNRCQFEDRRVHCCLYFISPNGHGLKDLDISFMKVLHDKVNLIPIIAKADTLSTEELVKYKKQLLEDIRTNSIEIYDFSYEFALTDNDNAMNSKFIDRLPFGVVGSNRVIEVDGKFVHGREYPWGIVDIYNLEHCDFSLLQDVLVRYHMQNLKDLIHTKLYEKFRAHKLTCASSLVPQSNPNSTVNSEMYISENEVEGRYQAKYRLLLNKHELYMKDINNNLHEFEKDIRDHQQTLEMKQGHFMEEKKKFEQEHVDFVKSVTETGSIPGKKATKKSKN